MSRVVCFLMILLCLGLPALPTQGGSPDLGDEISVVKEELKRQQKLMEDLMLRLQKLEAARGKAVQEEKKKASSWSERIKVHGDLRYRHELIDKQGKKTRNRQRIRARVGVKVKASDTLSLGLQLATGNDDPVSTNQTLDGGFSSKSIRFDLAFFDWHPHELKGLQVIGGKMKTPFFRAGKSELLWDSDLRPEGLAVRYSTSMGGLGAFMNGGAFWLEENSQASDSILWGCQGGLSYRIRPAKAQFLGGAGYFYFSNAKGTPPFFDPEDSFGNTLDEDGNYANDFGQVELFSQITFKADTIPVTVFGDYVINTGASDNKQGWLAGFMLGKGKKPGTFAFRYNYRRLESDAVIGIFTDSDFIGGGTGGKGHETNLIYRIAKYVKGEVTYFYNQVGLEEELDYHRLQVDVSFKF